MAFDTPISNPGSSHQAAGGAASSQQPLYSDLSSDPDMIELVEMFVEELPDRIASIRQAVDQANLADLAKLSHQLKGACGGYGFPSITQAAAAVEKLAKSQAQISDMQSSLDELLALCNRATSQPKP